MRELLNALGPAGPFVLGFAMFGLMAIVIVALDQWRRIEQRRLDTNLKKELLARGMSADEIARVIEAGRTKGGRIASS